MTSEISPDIEQLAARIDRLEALLHAELSGIREDAASNWGRTQLLLQAVRSDVIKLLGHRSDRPKREPRR